MEILSSRIWGSWFISYMDRKKVTDIIKWYGNHPSEWKWPFTNGRLSTREHEKSFEKSKLISLIYFQIVWSVWRWLLLQGIWTSININRNKMKPHRESSSSHQIYGFVLNISGLCRVFGDCYCCSEYNHQLLIINKNKMKPHEKARLAIRSMVLYSRPLTLI